MILAAASYVHDYQRVLDRCTKAFEHNSGTQTVDDLIKETLATVDFPTELVSRVCDCVAFASQDPLSGDALDASVEERILRDANKLDALGAIGIARAFMFGAANGTPIWLEYTQIGTGGELVPTASIVHHFHDTLLHFKEEMLTETGRVFAEAGHDFMVFFLDALEAERAMAVGESYPPG